MTPHHSYAHTLRQSQHLFVRRPCVFEESICQHLYIYEEPDLHMHIHVHAYH